MRIEKVHSHFHESRVKRGLVTVDIARSVAAHRRSILSPPRRRDGQVEVFGYYPPLEVWVLVIVNPGYELFNAYVEWNHNEEIRRRLEKQRR